MSGKSTLPLRNQRACDQDAREVMLKQLLERIVGLAQPPPARGTGDAQPAVQDTGGGRPPPVQGTGGSRPSMPVEPGLQQSRSPRARRRGLGTTRASEKS